MRTLCYISLQAVEPLPLPITRCLGVLTNIPVFTFFPWTVSLTKTLFDFSFDSELNWKKVETCQRLEFLPFLQARLQQKQDSPPPEFNVSFSLIGTAKPTNEGSADKEFILLNVNVDEDVKPGKIYSKVMALGNRLMGEIGLLTLTPPFTDKTLMNIDVGRPKDKPFLQITNIQLYQGSFLKTLHYYTVNQAIMDMIAKALILRWEDLDSTEFVLYITIHHGCN